MKKNIQRISLILFFIFSMVGYSQSNKMDKKIEKAKELINKDKKVEAEELLEKALIDYPESGEGWDLLANLRYQLYKESKSLDGIFGGNMTITVKDKDGKEKPADQDSLATQLKDILAEAKPSKTAYKKYIYTLRKGALLANDATGCSIRLRVHFVDEEIDNNIPKKAIQFFNEAEKEFGDKNYEAAAKLYRRALEEKPDFYKARLYLGDTYYATKNYAEAAAVFKEAKEKYPNLLEPRKYLADAYSKQLLYDKALAEMIETMTIYPDYNMYLKMENICVYNNKKINIDWTQRKIFPNVLTSDSSKKNTMPYVDTYPLEANDTWKHYQNAAEKIKPFCNSKGIITGQNDLTKTSYLEIYSWEEMLKNSNDPSLAQAKKMQQDGYLDCYVMVTCFHYDLYDQYKEFVKANHQKVIDYFNKYIY